jgi:hypothetical protein
MSELTRFWLDWFVQFLVAVGTIGAVVVALFADWFKGLFVKLSLSIENPGGVFTPTIRPTVDGELMFEVEESAARYYRLRVKNTSRLVKAHQVYIWLLAIHHADEKGELSSAWTGELPLIWEHKDQFPGARSLGEPKNADVVAVSADGELTLQSLIPALALPGPYKLPCCLVLTVQARSDEGSSPETRLLIEWDGRWDRGDKEMREHLKFEILDDDPSTG